MGREGRPFPKSGVEAACGTPAGYEQHRRRHEAFCEPCRQAHSAYMKEWRAKNPDYDRDREPRYRSPEQRRGDKMYYRYGLADGMFEDILEWQRHECLCCGADKPGGKGTKGWHVDHDHDRLIIRGLICERDNRLLAQSGDNAPAVARTFARLLAYLARSGDSLSEADLELLIEALRMRSDCEHLPNSERADPDREGRPRHADDWQAPSLAPGVAPT